MDQWLVRTYENRILGPYSGEQLRRLVADRKLGPQDEICRANSYWIHLHETQEVYDQLGIRVDLSEGLEEVGVELTHGMSDPSIPDLVPDEERGEETAVMSNRLFRQSRSQPNIGGRPSATRHSPEVRGVPGVEIVRIWKFLAVLLGVLVVVLLYGVLRSLSSNS